MSEPIRSKQGDISKAPTPQNTPASLTNSYLKTQLPTVSTINEEDEEGRISKQLANNPALISMIQGKLGNLIGQQSGYIDSLSKEVKNRVYGLKAIQHQQMRLEAEFQKELLELEKKYFKKYEPLYARRRNIIGGDEEPSAEEVEDGLNLSEDIEQEAEVNNDTLKEENSEEGIPGFWLTSMENLPTVSQTITERDCAVLQYLKDVRMEYLETPGFELIFEFEENPYFTNTTLSKAYHYQAELGYSGDFVYDHADGCEISWKSNDKNVTINIERRKQRNKNTKQTRTIEKLTPAESFFNFFDPPTPPKDFSDGSAKDLNVEEEDEQEEDDLEARLELDYQLGEEIKDRLIPRAIDWFTGDAVGYDLPEEYEDFDSEEEDSDDDDDDEDDDDEVEQNNEKPPECNQQ